MSKFCTQQTISNNLLDSISLADYIICPNTKEAHRHILPDFLCGSLRLLACYLHVHVQKFGKHIQVGLDERNPETPLQVNLP